MKADEASVFSAFACMYHFGLRASEVGLLLREHVNFRTRRIYIPRLKGGIPGEKVITSDIRRLLQTYLQTRADALPYFFPSRNLRPIGRKKIDVLFKLYAGRARLPPQKHHSHCKSIRSTGVYARISDAKRERVAYQIELSRDVAKIGSQRGRGRR